MSEPGLARCAAASLAAGEPVSGTAPTHQRFLLVECDLPWAAKLLHSDRCGAELRRIEQETLSQGQSHRLQAITRTTGRAADGLRQVTLATQPARPFAAYERATWRVPDDQVAALCLALLSNAPTLAEFAAWRAEPAACELLVCTHQEHDVCCGELGRPLYEALRERAEARPAELTLWRSSHLGGHRFAPTLLELPAGRYWGRMTPELAAALLDRQDPAALVDGYRGWSALPGGPAQVADGALFAAFGWSWLDAPRAVTVRSEAPDAVTCLARTATAQYEVVVEPAPALLTLSSSGDAQPVSLPQWRVRDWRQTG